MLAFISLHSQETKDSRQAPLLGETRKNGFVVANMIQNRCLEENWRKNFRMSNNEFMKLVDSYRNGSQCSVYMIPV